MTEARKHEIAKGVAKMFYEEFAEQIVDVIIEEPDDDDDIFGCLGELEQLTFSELANMEHE